MPPKKKPDAKKAGADEDEYKGPNIYKELLVKDVNELKVDLDAPDNILNNENVEFEILVDRLNLQIKRLATDNERLLGLNAKVTDNMDVKESVQDQQVKRALDERNRARADQEKERVDFKETKEDQKLMREKFGKYKQTLQPHLNILFIYSVVGFQLHHFAFLCNCSKQVEESR